MSLLGKNILITGASRGLGKELTHHLWNMGANLTLVAKNNHLLNAVRLELPARSDQQVNCISCDFGNESSLSELVEKLSCLEINAVINNAATQGFIGRLENNDWEDWKNTIQVNLLAPVYICRALVPLMLANKNKSGVIINLSGGGVVGPRANFSAYAASKAGLVGFSATLAEELKDTNIRINCIAPGPLPTDMLKEVVEVGSAVVGEKEFKHAAEVVSQSSSSFARVANLCAFLVSDESKGISGKLISAIWDPWEKFEKFSDEIKNSDIYTLRRIVPKDRGKSWFDLDALK